MQINVLMLSQRRISDLVAYCLAYEFEDAIAAVTAARRVDVTDLPALEFSRRAYRRARFAAGSQKIACRIAPYPRNKVDLDSDFDLFFPVLIHAYELHSLAVIPGWRQRCRKAACFITEVWTDTLPEYLIELLSEFDHIVIGTRNSVDDVERVTGRPCTCLPLAVDVLRFAPTSLDAPRPIAVCNIGRRSQITHQALLDKSDRLRSFYYYDTVAASGEDKKHRTFRVDTPREHRRMLASILQHSGYFANRSYVNRPEFTAGREEISARFYEGAAAGTVMIGEAPETDDFRSQFDWRNAVVHVPFDSPDISRIRADLDRDTDRLRAVQRNNVREAARRHDWLHRIQAVFEPSICRRPRRCAGPPSGSI